MVIIPTIKPKNIYLSSLYTLAFGNIFSIDKIIIKHATNINTISIITGVIICLKKIKDKTAPKGSDNPDIKVYFIANFLFLVA